MAAASMPSGSKSRTSATAGIDARLLFRLELRIGEKQRRVEMAEEQGLGEAQRLRAGEEQFLGLLFLLVKLRGESGPWRFLPSLEPIRKGVRHRCAKHPPGRAGNGA